MHTHSIRMIKVLLGFALALFLFATTGCGVVNRVVDNNLNPYTDVPENAYGTRDLSAIGGGGNSSKADRARHALNVMSTYQRAHAPQPVAPAIRPAVVRLMWVPDHLNRAGDLVPAHYYYLKVLDDRWAVQDAFELESQLNINSGRAGSATPYIFK